MEYQYENELVHETSPYLLQHAHNPVNWFPWGDIALKKAKEENKLMVISVGYSACHWCHVMEHESFEDNGVAQIMNDHFVSVKVDREERPDVDQVYMNAAYIVQGSGGWPLNVLALPNGMPVYAGTYFPRENWSRLLAHFASIYENQPAVLEEQAQKISQGINKMGEAPLAPEPKTFNSAVIHQFTLSILDGIDFQRGGTRGAPKFPMPVIFAYLLHYFAIYKDEKVLDAVNTTLTQMAMGGIYDQVAGGFSRYSVDDQWFVPHFEKMLYDNAQLVSLYARAYQLTKNPFYQEIVFETLAFIEREMSSPQGGFYAALDADSEGVEGKFYTWTRDEINELLAEDSQLFSEYYNVITDGNWENQNNILFTSSTAEEFANQHNLNKGTFSKKLKTWKNTLLQARSHRVRPGLDNKVLTAWNALMLNAYVDAYRVFNKPSFLEIAKKNAAFITRYMIQDDFSIMRNYVNDQASINGFLDDYAFTISAFTNLYQATFDEQYLQISLKLTEYTLQHLYDGSDKMFFYTSDQDKALITRNKEWSDNVIPSSNSEMIKNLFLLGTFFEKRDYIIKALASIGIMQESMLKHASFHTNWGITMLHMSNTPFEVAILGKDAIMKRAEIDANFLPQALFLGGESEGTLALLQHKLPEDQTLIYVCKDKTCKLPVADVKDALKQLDLL